MWPTGPDTFMPPSLWVQLAPLWLCHLSAIRSNYNHCCVFGFFTGKPGFSMCLLHLSKLHDTETKILQWYFLLLSSGSNRVSLIMQLKENLTKIERSVLLSCKHFHALHSFLGIKPHNIIQIQLYSTSLVQRCVTILMLVIGTLRLWTE